MENTEEDKHVGRVESVAYSVWEMETFAHEHPSDGYPSMGEQKMGRLGRHLKSENKRKCNSKVNIVIQRSDGVIKR